MDAIKKYSEPRVFTANQRDEELEDLVKLMLEKVCDAQVEKVELLSVGSTFDTFKVASNRGNLCFKYSLDTSSPFFSREAEALKQLYPFCPKVERYGNLNFGEKMQYILTSFEDAETMADFGVGSFFEFNDSFFYSFNQLEKVKTSRPFSQYFSSFFEKRSLEFLQDQVAPLVEDHTIFERFVGVLNILKNEIERFYNRGQISSSSEIFCHGNLKPSNILVRGGLFKFIDLQECFLGSRFFDLIYFFTYLGLNLDQQKSFVEKYHSLKQQDFNNNDALEYNDTYNLCLRLCIYQEVFNHLIEVYIYEGKRQKKLLDNVNFFLRNEFAFSSIPSLGEYQNFLFERVTRPILLSS